MAGNGPSGSTVPAMMMPSYFPVPPTTVLVTFPSPVEKYVRRLPPSTSIASHTVDAVIFPSSEAFIPTQRKVFLSNMPPGGLLRLLPVISKLDAVWVLRERDHVVNAGPAGSVVVAALLWQFARECRKRRSNDEQG